MNYEPLERAMEGRITDVHPGTFAEIRSALKEQHGEKGWIGSLVTDLTGYTTAAKSGLTKGTPEYARMHRDYNSARKQIERMNTGKASEANKRFSSEQLKAVGEKLPAIRKDVPAGGVMLRVKFEAPEDKGHSKRTRKADITISSAALYQYVNKEGGLTYKDVFNEWFDDGGEHYGDGGDYEVEILSVEVILI